MFPEWNDYLKLEKEGESHKDLIDVDGEATNGNTTATALQESAASAPDAVNGGADGALTSQEEVED